MIPEPGETFTTKIDRRSSSGNGLINIKSGQNINIGPVKEDAVGKEVELEMLGGIFARCKTEEVKGKQYNNKLEQMAWQYIRERRKEEEAKQPYSLDPLLERLSSLSNVETVEFCDDCGSIMKIKRGEWECDSCGSTNTKGSDGSTSEIDTTTLSEEYEAKGSNPNKSLEELRKEAVEDSKENISTRVPDSSHTQEYNRSPAVKNYVKARADGYCEGCKKPAPFISKTGEPYLHAHHIHELSDGGSDTPDTVIALCPNCHYRVHHGEDGEEYNEELLKTIQDIEE